MNKTSTIGVLCSGGSCPGFNSVIFNAYFVAKEHGFKLLGFKCGFHYLQTGKLEKENHVYVTDEHCELYHTGGSFLQTSRANPKNLNEKNPKEGLKNCLKVFKKFEIQKLITIGGDDTLSTCISLLEVAKEIGQELRIVHVPKTIDDDIPLGENSHTFGFKSCAAQGSRIVDSLLCEARTSKRFFIVKTNGRRAGWLAMEVGFISNATYVIIPEEVMSKQKKNKTVSLETVCRLMEGVIIKRIAQQKPFGVILFSEGVFELMKNSDLCDYFGEENLEMDQHQNVLMSQLNPEYLLVKELKKRLSALGKRKPLLVPKKVGHECRVDPEPYDKMYIKQLSYYAVEYLLSGENESEKPISDGVGEKQMGVVVTVRNGVKGVYIPFTDFPKDSEGKVITRMVDVENSEYFKVTKAYQIKLKKKDLKNDEMMKRICEIDSRFGNVDEIRKYFFPKKIEK